MKKIKTLIITGVGLNCEKETGYAFSRAGSDVKFIHLNDFLADPVKLHDYQILAFIGGFAYGDHISAGRVFANKFKFSMADDLIKFIHNGNLIIGICNGFQTVIKLGILPGFDNDYFTQLATLTNNDSYRFEDRWINLTSPSSNCVFTKGISSLMLPIRHGEGKLVCKDNSITDKLFKNKQIVFQYSDPSGNKPTMDYPLNPNGSAEAIAGICDPTGRVFGLMPHPEGYLSPYNHPNWTKMKALGKLPEEGAGLKIFKNAVEYFN